MIKEYDDVKEYMYNKMSIHFSDSIIKIYDIFIDEYNAIDINITGINKIPPLYISDFKYETKRDLSHLVNDVEFLQGISKNQSSIIVYLKPVNEIRHNKINKIKTKITI